MNLDWQVDSRKHFPTRMSLIAAILIILLTVFTCLATNKTQFQSEMCVKSQAKSAVIDGIVVFPMNNCYVLPTKKIVIQFGETVEIDGTIMQLENTCRHYTLTIDQQKLWVRHQYDEECPEPIIKINTEFVDRNTPQLIGHILSCLLMYRYIFQQIVHSYGSVKIKLEILKKTNKQYCCCLQKIWAIYIWLYGLMPIKPDRWLLRLKYVWCMASEITQKISIDWMIRKVGSGRLKIPLNYIDYNIEVDNDLDEECWIGHVEKKLVDRKLVLPSRGITHSLTNLLDLCGVEPRFTIQRKTKTSTKICNIILVVAVIAILSISIKNGNTNYTDKIIDKSTLKDLIVQVQGQGLVRYGAACGNNNINNLINITQPVIVRLTGIDQTDTLCQPIFYIESDDNISVDLFHFKVEKDEIVEFRTTFRIQKKCADYVVEINELQETLTGKSYVEYISGRMNMYQCQQGIRFEFRLQMWKKVFHNVEEARQSILKALGAWGFVYFFVIVCMIRSMHSSEKEEELLRKLKGGTKTKQIQEVFDLGDLLRFLNSM